MFEHYKSHAIMIGTSIASNLRLDPIGLVGVDAEAPTYDQSFSFPQHNIYPFQISHFHHQDTE